MEQEHERVEELLAGYVLLSLSEEETAEADRLLAEHVPTCLSCRRTLRDLRAVAADLALDAAPVAPPDLVWARIRRGLGDQLAMTPRARRASLLAVAVGILAMVALGGLSFLSMSRANRAEDDRSLALELLSLMRSPDVEPVAVEPQGGTPDTSGFVAAAAPDVRSLYLVADVCPEPRPGHAYQLWLGAGGEFTPVGDMFVPISGSVLIKLTVDVTRFDAVWITEEPAGSPPGEPNTEGRSWRAELS